MNVFTGNVAVITGAASGIGLGLAERCASENLRLVLADRDNEALLKISKRLSDKGTDLIAVPTDVSNPNALNTLADAAYNAFGQVDLLVNNAGVLISGLSWERPIEDWQWILNVNLMGVVHGLHSFVPRMLAQDTPGHIVNIASLAGLLASPMMGPYTVSKQAVVALTETLHYELESINAKLKTSVVCPGPIATNIVDSGKNRVATSKISQEANAQLMAFLRSGINEGMTPEQCAEIILEGIREERFWIFTHEDFKDSYKTRADSVLQSINPVYRAYVSNE